MKNLIRLLGNIGRTLRVTLPRIAAVVGLLTGILNVDAAPEKELHTPRYYYNRANDYIERHSWDAAKHEIDLGLEQYADDPDLRYLNGRYYYEGIGDLRQARYNLVKALQENDQHFQARRMLVDVEEDAGHFSSALCYINELLEFEPYDRDLWRRKIYLYNKMGHTVEADNALERLARIYPNDSVVQRDLSMRNRESWNQMLQTTTMSESAANLEHYIELDPTNIDYYFALIDLYRKLGEQERALGAVNRALYYSHGNDELIRIGANILTGMGEYVRALEFLRENRTGGKIYDNVLEQVVADDRIRDPYEASARLFARTQNRDALAYLLNTSLTRGYYDDAKYYLNEAMKLDGVTTELLMKEYTLEQRFGNKEAQRRILQRLYYMNPDDEEIEQQYAEMMIQLANGDIADQQWSDALDHLRRALEVMLADNPLWPSTVSKEIMVYGKLGQMTEARWAYEHAVMVAPGARNRFAYAYEEVAAARLKNLIEEQMYEMALKEAEEMLAVLPDSETALRACINLSQTLMRDKKFWEYAAMGYERYPENPYFIVKQATALQQQGMMADALKLLEPRPDAEEYVRQQLAVAFQGVSLEWVNILLKHKQPDAAMMMIDRALEQNPNNKELLYAKGLAYEQLKDYAKAYEYQNANYNPSNAEQHDWLQHMRYLRFRGYRNRVDASYTYASYDTRSEALGSVAHLYSIATVSYSRLTTYDTYMAQVSYKGIDGYIDDGYWESGGMGLELALQWDHTFNHKCAMTLGASVSNQYFNKYGATLGVAYSAPHSWTVGLRGGYRRTPPSVFYFAGEEALATETEEYNLFIVSPWVEKAWERIRMTAGVDVSLLRGNIFYNVNWKGKVFINEDNISSIGLSAGYGSFPELQFYDQSVLGSSDRQNASLGFDFTYLLTKNFYIGVNGTWNTFYNPLRGPEGQLMRAYRNVYVLGAQLHVAF